jgi:hypothetical protein
MRGVKGLEALSHKRSESERTLEATMFLPDRKKQSGAKQRADWMPDPGVHLYVYDMLSEDFGIQVDQLPEHWIPLTIVGVLDWIVLCQWWIFRNTGIFESDDPYKFVFDYDGYEFDPDRLLVFREEPERHKLAERLEEPGITGKERTEALPFLAQDIFVSWLEGEQNLTPDEAEQFIPPQAFLEVCMWATFMWVLDEYGRDWIYMQDEILACVIDFQAAYYSRWDETLLDPNIMVRTNRQVSTCRYCGEKLWCVSGGVVNQGWQFVCNHCMMEIATESHHHVDKRDDRILHPKCPHWRGIEGVGGDCMSTCPHSGMTSEKVWQKMEDHGSQRVEAYRDTVRELGGRNPRQMAGQSVDDIVRHFGGAVEDRRAGRRRLEDRE